jgi:hypothetical protein
VDSHTVLKELRRCGKKMKLLRDYVKEKRQSSKRNSLWTSLVVIEENRVFLGLACKKIALCTVGEGA